jgi:hypothetical protein
MPERILVAKEDESASGPSSRTLQIVIPVYNDWESVRKLLPLISDSLSVTNTTAEVLLVDDGSQESAPATWDVIAGGIEKICVLGLHRNLGHQRAICVALCHLLTKTECEYVLVMDGDGEDDPADIPKLLQELDSKPSARIVFAERAKRSEGWMFAFFYAVYRFLHRILVGQRVRVGNFSVMKRSCLESLCTSSELWNHYAASAFATRQPMSFVKTNRATRLAGQSKMNFPSLVMHGLSALSVFSDRISTRLLISSGIAGCLLVVSMIIVAAIRLTTGYAIPGWATTAFGILAVLLAQVITFMLTFCFLILFTRGFSPFIPVRDHAFFVREVEEVWRG